MGKPLGAEIAPMSPGHWRSVRAIYLEGIATRNATFETDAPEWDKWDAEHLPHSRLVALVAGEVAGWAALSAVSKRPVYAGVAEVSVYVAARSRRLGLGRQLLRELVRASEQNGIWTLQAGIFPENSASIQLHLGAGFRIVGTRERVGCLDGRWRNVTLLERRTPVTGA